ncbi:caspase domain-containing protein [Kitasatospora sp. NPDC052896]|uniref:caspase domain-containing protein n=1 Tax=Kitasatospora sp. NPDC052896 TaxID=3364061 RepID=UPI0037C84E06
MADRYALIVANDLYEHEGLSRLTAPAHDAEALQAVLGDPQIGRFQVRVIHNQPSHVIRREISDFFADRRPDDFLLLHFSCHGLKGPDGALYFAGSDTVPTRLPATGVAAHFVNAEMFDSRARRVALFLDCCYGGAFSRGVRARADDTVDVVTSFLPPPTTGPGASVDGRGRVVITASSATEYAFEDDRLTRTSRRTPSVFTGALVEGLRTGAADTDGDGLVDVDELYEYVYARVRATTSHQTPQKWVDLQGRLVIGWAPPAARLVAAELPPELVSRTGQERAADRLAGVRELRRILLDEDHGRAVGALDLLQRLTDDDSKEVSAAATAALEEAQLKAVPDRIDLTETRPGEPAPARTVKLVGSPLARVFQATTTSRWFTVTQSEASDPAGAWVKVTVDAAALPEQAAAARGSVSVLNRLGEFEIPVTAPGTGRLWARGSVPTPPEAWRDRATWSTWAADQRVVIALGAVILTAWPFARASTLHHSSVIGAGYFVLRAVLLLAGLLALERSDARRTTGLGLVFACAVYYLTDAVELLHDDADVFAWLEFTAVLALIGALVIRLWPLPAVPRRLDARPPGGRRPLVWLPLGAVALQLVLLFIAVPNTNGTLSDAAGPIGALLAVLPMGALCVAAALTEPRDLERRRFVTAAAWAYFGPEVYFLLGSLLLAPRYVYLGADVALFQLSAPWFVLVQAAAATVLALSTTVLLRGPVG